jgi:glyoxylase I family protein
MALDLKSLCPLIQVFDMRASLAFYCDVLGFERVSDSGAESQIEWCLLNSGGARLMLNTAYDADARPQRADPVRVAAHQDTSLYFECASVEGVYTHLLAKGVRVEAPKTAPYGMRQLHLRDPDGYVLCFQHKAE